MSKISLPTITNAFNLSTLNTNFSKIADALNNLVLYRKNPVGEPNQLLNDIDMNGNMLLNVQELDANKIVLNGQDINATFNQVLQEAQADQQAAAASASQAANSASSSASSASASNNYLTLIKSLVGEYPSSALNFQASFPESVMRTVQVKLEETLSVKDFGVIGDGETDDTVAIQKAVNSAIANNGTNGVQLFFPRGLYKISDTIEVTAGTIQLIGAGVDVTTVIATTDKDAFSFSGTSFDAGVSNMRILTEFGSPVYSSGISMSNGIGQLRLGNLRIQGFYNGISANNPAVSGDLYISHVGLSNIVNDAVYINGMSTLWMNQSAIFTAGNSGINLVSAGGFWISDTIADKCLIGLQLNPATGSKVFDGEVVNFESDSSNGDGILINTTNGGDIYGINLSNVRSGFNTGAGIRIDGANTKSITITNFTIHRNVEDGLKINNGSELRISNGHIQGNSSIPTGFNGIVLNGGDDIYLSDIESTSIFDGTASNQNFGISINNTFNGRVTLTDLNLQDNVSGAVLLDPAANAQILWDGTNGTITPDMFSIGPGATFSSTFARDGSATGTDVAVQLIVDKSWRDNVLSIQNNTVSPTSIAGNAAWTYKNRYGNEKGAMGFSYSAEAGLVQGIVPQDTLYIEASNDNPSNTDTSFELRASKKEYFSYQYYRYDATTHNQFWGIPNGSGGGQTALMLLGANGYFGIGTTSPTHMLEVNGTAASKDFWLPPFNVASLPASPQLGHRATVADSQVAAAGNFGNIVTGGGGFTVPVFYDGSWRIG